MVVIRRVFVLAVLVICFFTIMTVWVVKEQGISASYWEHFDLAEVTFDQHGIPTIAAESWEKLIEAQGFVVASERMWQMDLLRRYSSGRLSEWFGAKTLEVDTKHVMEDWASVADRAVSMLPGVERKFCEVYAVGVNRFISEYKGSWGVEYSLMGVEPEKWSCADSILVMMYMAEFLTSSADYEARQSVWRERLSIEWQNFFFPKHHPWSKPMFGSRNRPAAPLPPRWQYLSDVPIDDVLEGAFMQFKHTYFPGSNGWAWSDGKTSFLAGDPHLNRSVPQIWYANRLRVGTDDWVVGASLAGIPGVVIGRNPQIAWTFTNLGEDVDDYLLETVNEDQTEYVAYSDLGKQYWQPIVKKKFEIKVKDEPSKLVEAWFTHRGPMSKRKYLPNENYYSRQWVALNPKLLALPSIRLNRSTNWKEFNEALDHMKVPAQAIVFADTKGQIGFRCSGVGVKRQVSGATPQDALVGEWQGFEDDSRRKRLLFSKKSLAKRSNQIVAANAQIWRDFKGTHRWAPDDRRSRIMAYLSSRRSHDFNSVSELQLDTNSRYHRMMLRWVATKAQSDQGEISAIKTRWLNWDGVATTDEQTFTEAVFVDDLITNLLVARVRNHFLGNVSSELIPEYEHTMRRSWMVKLFSNRYAIKAFGLSASALADYVLSKVASASKSLVPYKQENQWVAQHPFVQSVPVLGKLFRVDAPSQPGFRHLVLAERSRFGPSLRMVWDMQNAQAGRWSFPTGQSGHIRSRHYRDLQPKWHSHQYLPAFGDVGVWKEAGEAP